MYESWAWFAGIIDGEGTIGLTRNCSTENRIPVISVASTTPELLVRCQEIAGGFIVNKAKKVSHYKKSQEWRISGPKALDIMVKVIPWMIEPEKLRRASLLVSGFKDTVSPNGRYTEELLQKKRDLETEFFKNSKKVG